MIQNHTEELFVPQTAASQTVRSCLNSYLKWLNRNRGHWTHPQLPAYQEYLAQTRGLSRQSVAVYTSILRTRYREIVQDRELIGRLFADADPADQEWLIDEQIRRLSQAFADRSDFPVVTRAATLTTDEVFLPDHDALSSIVDQFNLKGLIGLRDAALITLMLATGLRDTEVIALTTDDLKLCIGGRAALRVNPGRGVRARPVFYGELEGVLDIVHHWLTAADIRDGLVFRGFYRRELRIREKLTPRALQSIFNTYPAISHNRVRLITPADLRRTYAFHLLENGADLYTIQVQLGIHDKSAVQQIVDNFAQAAPVRLPEIIQRLNRMFVFPATSLNYAEMSAVMV